MWTDRQAGRKTDRQTGSDQWHRTLQDRQTDVETDVETNLLDKHSDRQTDKRTKRWHRTMLERDRQTDW